MNLAGPAWVERVGIALLHSLWQGSLVGVGLLAALILLRGSRAQARYLASCAALALMLLLPVGTFLLVGPPTQIADDPIADDEPPPSRLATSAAAALEAAAALLPAQLPGIEKRASGDSPSANNVGAASRSDPDDNHPNNNNSENNQTASSAGNNRPWLSANAEALLWAMVVGWACGVVLLSCRMLGGHLLAWRLTRRLVEPLDALWQERVRRLAVRLNVRAPLELWQSVCVEAPVVIGCFRPAILVPVGLLTGLTTAQIEGIFAHELAHVRRYDFLVNAVQCLIETLLFYHPCAWWISARIRSEREHCCDEIAVQASGDALGYARALSRLEERRPPARLALALAGGNLLGRVRRIVGQRRTSDVVGGWLAGSLAIVLPLAVGAAWASNRAAQQHPLPAALAHNDLLAPPAEELQNTDPSFAAEAALFRDAVQVTNDLADTLATVTNASSAAATAEKIVELSRRHAEVERRLRELRHSLRPESEARLGRRWATAIEQASQRLQAEVARVEQLPGAVDALRSSVLFAVIGLHGQARESAPDVPRPAFLLPPGANARRFRGGNPLEAMFKEHGPERVVKVLVTGLPGDVYQDVYGRLQRLLPNLGYVGSGAGDTATVYLAPISDIDFYASKIELGEVTSIDREKRVINVVADHARLSRQRPRPTARPSDSPADDSDRTDLAALSRRLAQHDHSATDDLIALGQEAESTAAELSAHADRRVRRDALRALKQIGSKASLPAAIRALADDDLGNRDLAWQVICRLPGAAERRDVIAAAAAGLERDGEQAARWLTTVGAAAESAVLPYAEHREAAVRRYAADALKDVGGAKSLSPLKRLLDDPDAATAAAARKAYAAVAARQGIEP